MLCPCLYTNIHVYTCMDIQAPKMRAFRGGNRGAAVVIPLMQPLHKAVDITDQRWKLFIHIRTLDKQNSMYLFACVLARGTAENLFATGSTTAAQHQNNGLTSPKSVSSNR